MERPNAHGALNRPAATPRSIRERPAARAGSTQSLFDLDPDLAEGLDADTRRVARAAAVAVTVQADVGELKLAPWLELVGSGPGVLVTDGVLVVSVEVGARVAAELVGAGDLLAPPLAAEDELLIETVTWRALIPAQLAVLDGAFAKRIRFWPTITAVLVRRAAQRTRALNVQRAIAAQPRLDLRLALLMWHLAARWGKVEPGGVRLSLPLTHQLLGRMIGAERPSVSHALGRLTQAGLLVGHGDEWHLRGSVQDHLAAMTEPPPSHLARLVQPAGLR